VQYVAAVNWMRSAIPNFAERVSPLQAVLNKVFDGKTRRTKKAARAVALEQLWGDGAREAFKDIQTVIADSMTMAYPDPSKRICVLTDASERFYAGIVTQVDKSQLDLPIEQQDHQPLAFVSGEFKGAQLRWTVPEKEGFAVVDVVTKMDYILLIPSEFSILSDHLNLIYIYNPLSVDPTLARHVVHRLQRWALKMSVFAYRMEHVAGEVNFWTDLMTRWGVGWVAGAEPRARVALATIFEQPYIMPADEDKPEFPAKQVILMAQKVAIADYNHRKLAIGNGDKKTSNAEEPPVKVGIRGVLMVGDSMWVPTKAVDLQLRLCVEAHCGAGGHRGYKATLIAIKEYVN
jgi:hypothetical protein